MSILSQWAIEMNLKRKITRFFEENWYLPFESNSYHSMGLELIITSDEFTVLAFLYKSNDFCWAPLDGVKSIGLNSGTSKSMRFKRFVF